MLLNKIAFVCVVAACIALPGYSQPLPPPATRAPRAHSVGGRIVTSKRGWLGVGVVELTAQRSKAFRLKEETGVEITHVEENSPAAKAGLREHDVILEVNGQKVDDSEQFVRTIGETAPGSNVAISIWRNGSKQNATATLDSRPIRYLTFIGPNGEWLAPMAPLPPMPPIPGEFAEGTPFMTGQAPRVGFEGETLTPQLAGFFGVKEGVLVRTVSEKTPASKAGLKAGDVIMKVSGTPVSSTREISGVIRAIHGNVTFTVMRNHKEVLLNVEIASDRAPSSEREVL